MKIGFISDCVFGSNFDIASELENVLINNDLNIVNLEAPIVDDTIIEKNINGNLFRVYNNYCICDFFLKYKVKFCNIANNHYFDFGRKGFLYSNRLLLKNGIKYFGGGENIKEAMSPQILSADNKKYGFWGFAWKHNGSIIATTRSAGTADIDKAHGYLRTYEDIDYKIAYAHFGTEWEDYPESYFRTKMVQLIECGFDIIIGNHPHCMQGYEILHSDKKGRDRYIFYSLGNFIFNNDYRDGHIDFPSKSQYGFWVNVDFETFKVDIIPYVLKNDGISVSQLDDEEKDRFKVRLGDLSKPFVLSEEDYKQFYKKHRIRKNRPFVRRNKILNYLLWKRFYLKNLIKKNIKHLLLIRK